MRNSILSRPPLAGHSSQASNLNRARSPTFDDLTPPPVHHDAPTIRFISSTPAHSSSSTRDAASFAASASASTSLAPRQGEPSRRRLVPKKSKLGLLATKTKERVNKDLSDIARRVGADTPSTGRGPYEIYVDHDEEEEGSIIVVKKKKSRMGLDGMGWGALGEVTNVPSGEDREEKGSTKINKPKARKSMEVLLGRGGGDENQKWWNVSIGRGRKEVKEKKSTDTIQPRSKTPDPFQPSDTRSRFNSLDAGALLSSSDASDSTPTPKSSYVPRRKSSVATIFGLPERSKTPSADQELHSENPRTTDNSDTTPTTSTSKHAARRKSSVASIFGLPERSKTPSAEQDLSENTNEPNASTTGSIALRAMRSVRSLAHMASWATMRSSSNSSTTTNNNSDREGNHTRALSDVTTLNTKSSMTVTTRKTKGRSEEKEKEREREKKKKRKEEKEGSRREKKSAVEDGDKTPKQKKKRSLRLRTSASSFEGGSLTRQASMIMMPPAKVEETVKKKQSTLGLGIPATMKLSAMRSSSSLSKDRGAHPPKEKEKDKGKQSHPPPVRNRFSSDSAHLIMGPNGRPASSISSGTSSSATSFRPASSLSGVSAFSMRSPRSSNGSVASVRWDEAGLQTVKEMQRRERERRRLSTEPPQSQTQTKSVRDTQDKEKESQRGSGATGRRRATIADIFPEVRQQQASLPAEPISPIGEVSIDSHHTEDADTSVMSTVKKARRRPMSEQMFGKPRPKAMSDDGDGVKSILDAATDELASLIDRLDLEATPKDSPRNNSPVRRTAISLGRSTSFGVPRESSPIKTSAKCTFNPETDAPLLETLTSRTSHATLRNGNALSPAGSSIRQQVVDITDHRPLLGKQIAPWSTLDWEGSPKRPAHKLSAIFRPSQRRSRSPEPEDPSVVFEPLVPAARKRVAQLESLPSTGTPVNVQTAGVPSSSTFGSGAQSTKIGKQPSTEFDDDEPTPPSPSPPSARRSKRHSRKSSVLSAMCDSGVILPPAAMKSFSLARSSSARGPDSDDEDSDSDIPDELQNILANQSDDESINALDSILSSRHQSLARISAIAPLAALPLSQAYTDPDGTPVVSTALLQVDDDEDCDADIDDAVDQSPREDDTYKSFDFTGELQKLIHDSGESDRRSFVEQLENAFRTPELDLGFSLGRDFSARCDVAQSPAPGMHHNTPEKDLVAQDVAEHDMSSSNISMSEPARSESDHDHSRSYCHSSHSDTLDHLIRECEEDICMQYPIAEYSSSLVRPKASDGKLNMNFKFGGRPSISDLSFASSDKPLTLSDIIPPIIRLSPPSNSIGDDNSSILHSLFDHPIEGDRSSIRSAGLQAVETSPQKQALLQQRPRLVSDASSKRLSQDLAQLANSMSSSFGHSKRNSEASFTGFEAFEEVRRGFEFHPNANRAAFFPPPGANSRSYQNRFSLYSVATSYGEAFNSGVVDPFGYASSRPTSSDMSMAMSSTVEDTFSFLRKGAQRQRVESDASSFYFGPHASSHPHRRSRLCNEVNFSAMSNRLATSIYSQSFGAHFQDDSSSIASPAPQSYAPQSSQVDHAARIRQHQVPSTDSILSDLSSARLDRPGISDKMFERDYGIALSSISASPPGSTSSFSEQYDQRMRPDSLYSQESGQQMASSVDSLFGAPGDNDNVFDFAHSDAQQEAYERLRQFRPLSIISTSSTHTEPDENDTMISMLGGGHVRRRSIDSGLKYSPCNNIERKKNTALQHLARVLQFDEPSDERTLAPTIPDRLSDAFSFKAAQSTESFASRSSEHLEVEHLAEEDVHQRPSLGESLFGSEAMLHPTQPPCAGRPRSSTASSGADTPPLLTCDVSSASSGSQHSIDVRQLNDLLNQVSHPSIDGSRTVTVRSRPPGSGHRRRFSQILASRTSIYETIEEESTILSSPQTFEIPTPPSTKGKVQVQPKASPPREPVIVVNSESGEVYQECWDAETGLVTMRRYSALREEAEETVIESKRVWHDTAFSVSSLQSFYPPKNKSGMRALLEQSKENYGPLPSELRPHRIRSRTSSRVSPYPIRPRVSPSKEQYNKPTVGMSFFSGIDPPSSTTALHEISINPHFFELSQPQPASLDVPPLPHFTLKTAAAKPEKVNGSGNEEAVRPRVSSGPRKPALGPSKRTRKTSDKSDKENARKDNTSKGISMSSSSGSLRLTRPRPRGSIPGRKVSQGA